jgi:hypothetical protein
MYNMKPDAILDWLMALPENAPPRRVNALQLQVQVKKIKRFCYLIKNAHLLTSIPPSFRNLPLASTPVISSVCTSLDFFNLFQGVGDTFDEHTAFILPGWNPGVVSQNPGSAMVLFSTCNFLLDWIRLQKYYGRAGGVCLQSRRLYSWTRNAQHT